MEPGQFTYGRGAAALSTRNRRMKQATTLALLALWAASVALVAVMPMNTDVAWYVQATRQWAAGQELYAGIGDVNLPSVYLLHRLAYEIAVLPGGLDGGQRDYHVLVGLFALLLLGAMLLAQRILDGVPELSESARRTVILAFPVVAASASLHNMLEREQWILVAILPHALCLYRRQLGAPAPRGLAIAAAVLAAVFALLKPHFLLPYLLIEVYAAIRRRSLRLPFRAENFIAAGVYLACAGSMVLAYPHYFTDILPRAQEAYRAFTYPWHEIVARSDVYLPVALAALLYLLAGRVDARPAAELARLLLILSLAFAVNFVLQSKGWYYQFVPSLAYGVLGSLAILAALLSEQLLPRLLSDFRSLFSRAGLAFGLIAGLAALMPMQLIYLGEFKLRTGWSYAEATATLIELLEQDPEGGYLNLSPAIHPAFPAATYSHARWVFAQPSLWELPRHYAARFNGGQIVPPRPPGEQSEVERAFYQSVVEALVEDRPRVVSIVDAEDPPQLWGRSFDFLAYFRQDPAFAAAWEDYEHWGEIPGHRVYLRRESGGRGGD